MEVRPSTIRIPPYQKREFQETAAKLGISLSELMLMATVEYVAKYSQKELKAKHEKVTKK